MKDLIGSRTKEWRESRERFLAGMTDQIDGITLDSEARNNHGNELKSLHPNIDYQVKLEELYYVESKRVNDVILRLRFGLGILVVCNVFFFETTTSCRLTPFIVALTISSALLGVVVGVIANSDITAASRYLREAIKAKTEDVSSAHKVLISTLLNRMECEVRKSLFELWCFIIFVFYYFILVTVSVIFKCDK